MALAIPTRRGQSLTIEYEKPSAAPQLSWEAFLEDGSLWLTAKFSFSPLELIETSDRKKGERLLEILKAARALNKDFFDTQLYDVHATTRLEFPEDWGWGSSSTLIWLLSEWTGVDPFILNKNTFKSSGYDVACAGRNTPLTYQLQNGKPLIREVKFNPPFSDRLFFVHLNQKQDTALSVAENYLHSEKDPDWINGISALTLKILKAQSLEEMEALMENHEELISSKLGLTKVKDLLFPDYPGAVKSLGAWGGDFVMVTAAEGFPEYFQSKGYKTILSFKELGV